jgi:hypothetical protein
MVKLKKYNFIQGMKKEYKSVKISGCNVLMPKISLTILKYNNIIDTS